MPVVVRSDLLRPDETDEAVENRKLKLELDAVHQGLEGGLDGVAICELHDEEYHVQKDEEDVDGENVVEGFAMNFVNARVWRDDAQVSDNLHHVEVRDNHLLHGETDQLDALHDIVTMLPGGIVRFGEIRAVSEDSCRHVKNDGIGDNHDQNAAQDSGIIHQ